MQFKIQIVIDDERGQTKIEDVICLKKNNDKGHCSGLSLLESKALLRTLQEKMVLSQAQQYTQSHRTCSECHQHRRIKGYHSIQYRTLFGIVVIPSLALETGVPNTATQSL